MYRRDFLISAGDFEGLYAIHSPISGGLVRHHLRSGEITSIADTGAFASPRIFAVHGKPMLAALRNPMIKSTRDFGAEIYLAVLP